jgi:hypothetical protein
VKVDTAPTKNHVADAVKDKLLKELAGLMGETDSEDKEEGCVLRYWKSADKHFM